MNRPIKRGCMLKGLAKPVGVYFETDNVNTLSENNEFMLSFLATFAQEESVKKSEAMNWSLAQRFKDGKLLTPALLGYDRPRDVTGRYIKYAPLKINEPEAKIVQFIYDAYLSGWSQAEIAAFLTDIGCETKTGSKDWNSGSIGYILTNERYCGNVLTWKTFTADLLEHKHKRNCKDRDQYLYMGRHDAIVSLGKFELVQTLLENRKHHLHGSLPLLHVIDEEIFRGFIPINHHWINNDPKVYYDIANSIDQHVRVRKIDKREWPTSISFNKMALQTLNNCERIRIEINPKTKGMLLFPVTAQDKDGIRWTKGVKDPVARKIECKAFATQLYEVWGLDSACIYVAAGKIVTADKMVLLLFDFSNAESWRAKSKAK